METHVNKYSTLKGEDLELHLSNYLLNSWSYSAVSCFCRNEKAFEQQYIYLEPTRRSASSVAGNAYHSALESYFKAFNEQKQGLIDLTSVAYEYLDGVEAKTWKLTDKFPTVENAYMEANKSVNALIENFVSEIETYIGEIRRVIDVEIKYSEWVTVNGVDIPLPLHFIVDLVVETLDGKIVIIDHKSKSKFTAPDELALSHGKQAITYVVGWETAHPGMKVDEVWFLENKISKNKDGSAQIVNHKIVMDDDTRRLYEYLLYQGLRRMIEAVSDPDYIYTINDTDNLADKASLYAFWCRTLVAEVDDFEYVPGNKKELIAKRQRKIKDSSLAMISPKVITSFRQNAASFITFDYSNSNMTNKEKIEHVLCTFRIQVEVAHEIEGFSCNTYLCKAAAGVQLSTIKKYALDIANALDVSNVRIPSDLVVYEGKSYLSIEVNKKRTETLMWDQSYLEAHKLPVGLDNFCRPIYWDLDNHSTPHCLVCGSTGSGKSVMIRSTVEYAKAAGIFDICILDPKYDYEDLRDGDTQVINEIEQIEAVMSDLVDEMNERVSEKKKTLTLVIFDEFADAAQQARKGKQLEPGGRSLMDNLQMLLQKGRSSGFRILAATQRADVKTIPGTLKVNFPVACCFRVPKAIDSKVVIDEEGANTLIGGGDGLIKSPEYLDKIVRFQGFFKES